MNTNKKALLAVAMVALMLAVPFTVISDSEQTDAASYWPTNPRYTYTMDFSDSHNITVKSGSNVMVSSTSARTETVANLNLLESHTDQVYKVSDDGNLMPGDLAVVANDLVKYDSASEVWVKCTAWTWDSNGVGPFGMFYAAVSLGAEDEYAISTTPGHIAYILDPTNLSQALKYKENGAVRSGTHSYTIADYNVMLVIPTVYWSVNGTTLTMGNSSTSGVAYAHTADGTTYPYLAIGVYEAYADDDLGLLSKSGVTSSESRTIDQFRSYVDIGNSLITDKVGTYQMWNFYEYTLYKIMAETYISSFDSQTMAGQGTSDGHGTGSTNTSGPATTPSNTGADKLLIENAWKGVWEFVDNVYVTEGVLKAGSGLANQLSSTNVKISGEDYTGGTLKIGGGNMGEQIATFSEVASTFGVPLTAGNSNSKIADVFYYNSSGVRCILVGADWEGGANAGLSAWSSYGNLSSSNSHNGARLAYLMSADAANTVTSNRVVSFVESDYTSSQSVRPGSSVTLFRAEDSSEGVFVGWYTDAARTLSAGTINSPYTPAGNVTLYAKYDPVATVAFYEWNGTAYPDTAGQSYSGLVSGDSVMIPGANSPTVTANDITYEFVGWYKAGTVPTTQILTTGQTNYANTLYDVGELTAITAVNMYAVYVASGDYWTVTVHENEHTAFASNTVVINVPKGDSFVLPEPAPSTDTGYTFGHWSASSEASQQEDNVLGYPGMIITPTADMDIYSWFSTIAQPNATITFQNDVGTVLAGETISAIQGQYITLPNCAVSQDGWVLKGWKLLSDTSETPTIVGTYGSKYLVPDAPTTTLVAVPMQLSSGGGSVDVNDVVLGDYYEPSEDSWVISTKTEEELAALFDIVIPAEILPGTHGMIMITPNSNYVIDHIAVADNTGDDDEGFVVTGVVVPLDKYRWMIQSVTGDVKIDIYMKEDDGTSYGVKDFYISGLTGTPSNDGMTLNTGAVVKLIGDDSGLKAGSVSIKGTRYTVDEEGMRTYASFTTTLQDTVGNGDSEFVGSLSLDSDEGQIYCVYAEYTDNANNVPTFKMVTAQLLAPRAA